MRVLIVEDEPYMAEAIRDRAAAGGDRRRHRRGRRHGARAAGRQRLRRRGARPRLPGPSGDEIAARHRRAGQRHTRSSCSPPPDRLDDKASGFELGADDYLTKPFELRELVAAARALDRRRATAGRRCRRSPGSGWIPFRREVFRDGRYVALTRKQFAVLEVLITAEGGVVSAEELLDRAWDENADPFTNAVRITVSALRKRLGEPWLIATVAGVGYRIDPGPDAARGDRG